MHAFLAYFLNFRALLRSIIPTISLSCKFLDVVQEALFRERDNGILAGMKYEEAKKKYPLPKIDGPFRRFPGNTGENEFELNARALLALNSIIDKGPGSYLIVSHGGILNAVMKRIMDIPIGNKESGVVFRLGDNGFIEVEYREEKNLWIIKRMEDGK